MKNKKKTEVEEVTIAYKGNVTIEQINSSTGKTKKRTQKHNTGKAVFFELLVQSIAGNNVTSQMPRYLKTFDETGIQSTSASFSIASNPIISKGPDSASVSFEFLLPFTQLSSSEDTAILRLFNGTSSSDINNPFAEVVLTEDDRFIGDGLTNYLITWTITIGNAS